jgi:hypothetical protein
VGITTLTPPDLGASFEVGFRELPDAGAIGGGGQITMPDRGRLVRMSGNIDFHPGVMLSGSIVTVLNASGSSHSLSQMAGFTLIWLSGAGTLSGTRLVANGSMVSIWWESNAVAYVTGAGLS